MAGRNNSKQRNRKRQNAHPNRPQPPSGSSTPAGRGSNSRSSTPHPQSVNLDWQQEWQSPTPMQAVAQAFNFRPEQLNERQPTSELESEVRELDNRPANPFMQVGSPTPLSGVEVPDYDTEPTFASRYINDTPAVQKPSPEYIQSFGQPQLIQPADDLMLQAYRHLDYHVGQNSFSLEQLHQIAIQTDDQPLQWLLTLVQSNLNVVQTYVVQQLGYLEGQGS